MRVPKEVRQRQYWEQRVVAAVIIGVIVVLAIILAVVHLTKIRLILAVAVLAVAACSSSSSSGGLANPVAGWASTCTINSYPNVTVTLKLGSLGVSGQSGDVYGMDVSSLVIDFYDSSDPPLGGVGTGQAEDSGSLAYSQQFNPGDQHTFTGTVTSITANPLYQVTFGHPTPNTYCALDDVEGAT